MIRLQWRGGTASVEIRCTSGYSILDTSAVKNTILCDSEVADDMLVLIFRRNDGEVIIERFVGLVHQECEPVIFIEEHILVVGAAERLLFFDSRSGELVQCHEFRSAFVQFISLDDRILAFHRWGLAAFDRTLSLVWEFDGDVIAKYSLRKATLWLSFDDNPPVTLLLSDGSEEKRSRWGRR